MRKREGTLDMIRIIASFGVLTIHVLAWLLEQPYTELEKYFLWVVHTLAPTGTRLFVMITGYFLLAYEFQKSLLVDDQIMVYLSKNGEISKNIARERTSIRLLRISNTLEQIGDIGKDLLESIVKSIKRSHADEVKQLLSPALLLIKQQQELLNAVGDSLVKNSRSELFQLQRGLSLYLQRISVAYTEYIQNLSRVNSPQRTLLVDVLSMLELSALKMRIICDLLSQSPQVRRRH